MFLNLGLEKDKKLNSNAKVILGARNATDKIFFDVRQPWSN